MEKKTIGQRPATLLVMAGSDPCGGAGLQADIRVAAALDCYAMGVVTALTSQNSCGVIDVWPLDSEKIKGQVTPLIGDAPIDAVKIGMLGNCETAAVVARLLDEIGCCNVVVDTILKSTSGACLFDGGGGGAFEQVLRRAKVITPNLPEAKVLLGHDIVSLEDAARELGDRYGGVSVYLKGGHGGGDRVTDCFYNAESGSLFSMSNSRIDSPNTHGTGCCLSTALAVFLGSGISLNEAATKANLFVNKALREGRCYMMWQGHGAAFVRREE